LPLLFSGLHIAAIQSILAAIVAEFVAAEEGLGVVNLKMVFDFDIAGSFATLFILAGLATAFFGVIEMVKKKVLFWIRSDETSRI
jgi:NitT/TauT family transport system permease protein